MKIKKKSAPVLAHRDAKTKSPTYSLASALKDVKRLLSGALGTIAVIFGMMSYGSAAERMYGWLVSLPLCAMSTLAAVWLWRQAEGGNRHDK